MAGDYVTQFVNRYGNLDPTSTGIPMDANQDKNIGLSAADADVNSRGLVTYVENWNEQDAWFHPEGCLPPEIYGLMSAIDYYGKDSDIANILMGDEDCDPQFSYPIGIKNMATDVSFVMSGLSKLDECYLAELKIWFDNADLAFPYDVLNFHNYSNTGGYGGQGLGISPEADDLQIKLKKLDLIRDEFFADKGRELWLSEFGYNTSPNYAAPPFTNPNAVDASNVYLPILDNIALSDTESINNSLQEVQGQWIVRTFLAAAAADFDKSFVYEIRDSDHEPIGAWDLKCGLLESSSNGFAPKKSWFYTYSLKNILEGMDFEEIVSNGSLDCDVDEPRIYKFSDGIKTIYAVWSPTSCGKEAYDFSITDIDQTLATADYYRLEVPSTEGIAAPADMSSTTGNLSVPISERPIFVCASNLIAPVECPILTEDNITCSSVTVSWDIPAGQIYDSYQIWYAPVGGVADINAPDIFMDDITLFEEDIDGSFTQAFVGMLEPQTSYYIYLIAETDNNSTGWCAPLEIMTNEEGCNIDIVYISTETMTAVPSIDNSNQWTWQGNPYPLMSDMSNMVTLYNDVAATDDWENRELWDPNVFSFAFTAFDGNIITDINYDAQGMLVQESGLDCCHLPNGVFDNFDNWANQGEVAFVDLKDPHDIDAIYLYDGAGVSSFNIDYYTNTNLDEPGEWLPYVNDYVTYPFGVWVAFTNEVAPCQAIQHLRIYTGATQQRTIGEIVLCGKLSEDYDDIDASFTPVDIDGCGTVTFTPTVMDPDYEYSWDFGDESEISTEMTPTHTFVNSSAGEPVNYNVTLTITNICPAPPVTQIVTVTNCETFGCDCPAESLVVGEPGQVTQLTDEFTSSPTGSVDVIVRGTLEIDLTDPAYSGNSFTLAAGSNICMDAGAEIIIKGGSEVNLVGTHIRGCTEMWKGIKVEADGELTTVADPMTGVDCLIEDARRAIEPLPNANLDIQNTQFNNNYIGIYAGSSPNGVTYTINAAPLLNNRFTSEGEFLATYEGQTPQDISNTYTGIFLYNTVGINVGMSGVSDNINTFEGIENGIIATRSIVDIHYAEFTDITQEVLGNEIGQNDCSILLRGNIADSNISNCTFENCRIGIKSRDSGIVASDNTMNNLYYGMVSYQVNNKNIEFTNNTINNCLIRAVRVRQSEQISLSIDSNTITMGPNSTVSGGSRTRVGENRVEVSAYANGVYFLRIGAQNPKTVKLIIQH